MATKTSKLNIFLSNLAVINIKIHNLHWNVVGREFKMAHKMTEKLYQMFQLQFDEVAEAMKMQNEQPLASLSDYLDNTTIEEIESRPYPVDEVLQLLDEDCQDIMTLAKKIRDEADKNDNFLIANMFEDYLALYAKHSWMLRAMLEDEYAGYEEIEEDSDDDSQEKSKD